VDAYGTGASNHWHHEVMSLGDDVTYYDINQAYVPRLSGAKFEQADVEKIEAGSGNGKIIVDDTFNAPDNDFVRLSVSRKVASIINAGYDAGVIKMFYGSGEDGKFGLAVVPPSLTSLMEKHHVYLCPGGSPHSPEYFAVFFSKDIYDVASFPALTTQQKWNYNLGGASQEGYLRAWLVTKAMEVVKSNLELNYQVYTGVHSNPGKSFPTYGPCVLKTKVKLSGTFIPSAIIPEDVLAPQEQNVLDFGN